MESTRAKTEVLCKACGGSMKKAMVVKHSKKFGMFLLGFGIVCILFWVGIVLGVPLAIMGIYMLTAKRSVWMCRECQSVIERYQEESFR